MELSDIPKKKKKKKLRIRKAVKKLGQKSSEPVSGDKVNKQLLSSMNLGQGGIGTKAFLKQQKHAPQFNALENLYLSSYEAEQAAVDPYDETSVGGLVCKVVKELSVDARSIGGTHLGENDKSNATSSNLLLQENSPKKSFKLESANKKLMNEWLICMRVGKFHIEGNTKHNFSKKKAKNKFRYVCIVRSTNRPLFVTAEDQNNEMSANKGNKNDDDGEIDVDDSEGYDSMFTEFNMPSQSLNKTESESNVQPEKTSSSATPLQQKNNSTVTDEEEISSFPYLLCVALHSDGTSPDIRKVISLSTLVSIANVKDKDFAPNISNLNKDNSQGSIRLKFKSGDTIDINPSLKSEDKAASSNNDTATLEMRKERLLWSLLQIHSILCVSVVENHVATYRKSQSLLLAPLLLPNIDRAELQYVSTVNGFLSDSPTLITLLDRQRMRGSGKKMLGDGDNMDEDESGDINGDGMANKKGKGMNGIHGESLSNGDNMDGMAYDMMMGNYARFNLFQNPEEEKDAADILNASSWQPGEALVGSQSAKKAKKKKKKNMDIVSNPATNQDFDASSTADALTLLLEKRMRDLEAETCRRLIAWEDEKNRVAKNEIMAPQNEHESADFLSLSNLFSTLDGLDYELRRMEEWLDSRASIIKPLTDDCKALEEENRQLEQHCRSYDTLGAEMERLLSGLHIPEHMNEVLQNPGAVIPFVQTMSKSEYNDSNPNLARETNEEGVNLIYEAGCKLKEVLDRAYTDGGMHLRAINQQLETLNALKVSFSNGLSMISVRIMETLATDIEEEFGVFDKDNDSHTVVLKKLKDTQRKFQASFLIYKRLLEVIAMLQPELLDSIRAGYSELISEGNLSKKRMKSYFHSLPFKSCTGFESVTCDLRDYYPTSLKSGSSIAGNTQGHENPVVDLKPVNSQDIEKALEEILPLINREAYFTASMFNTGERKLDAAKKKRNFEAVKKSVDHSAAWFRYYIMRVLGIATESIGGQAVEGDPMLSLVSSIQLAETMETYLDKDKKGNEHSLALAYARFTIMGLKKGVEKQWVSWVEQEIKWIRSNVGVPLNGKRAGVFTSFLNFPTYLDHVMLCTKAKGEKSKVKITKFKTICYYLQKMAGALFASLDECSRRETTDQEYAATVMRMENTYFFTQSIKSRGPELNTIFAKQITAANSICKHSMDTYLGWMIKREFKQLHSLFSSISSIRKEVGDADVPIHVPRSNFIKTLQKESNKEVMKEKISIIYVRMEKHLSDEARLLPVAWKALVKVLYEWFGRWEKLSTECYKYTLQPSAIDMVKIAKAAGATSVKRPTLRGNRDDDSVDPEPKNGAGSARRNLYAS